MRNTISYKFNPLADNALEALKEIADNYMNEDFSSWQWTVNQERLYKSPESTLAWILDSEKLGHSKDYINLSHFNGNVFPSASSSPLSEDVRELSLYTPITARQIRAHTIRAVEEEEEDQPQRIAALA